MEKLFFSRSHFTIDRVVTLFVTWLSKINEMTAKMWTMSNLYNPQFSDNVIKLVKYLTEKIALC